MEKVIERLRAEKQELSEEEFEELAAEINGFKGRDGTITHSEAGKECGLIWSEYASYFDLRFIANSNSLRIPEEVKHKDKDQAAFRMIYAVLSLYHGDIEEFERGWTVGVKTFWHGIESKL